MVSFQSTGYLKMDKNRKIIIHKDETNERKIAANWGLVKRNVKLSDVVDPLIENGIITPDQWMDIKSRQVGEPEKMEEFLYILLKQKSEAFEVFKNSLRSTGFQHIADCLGGTPKYGSKKPFQHQFYI